MRKNKLTVIVVPEADRAVRRYRTSRVTITVILAVLIALAALCWSWLEWRKRSYDGQIANLSYRLSDERRTHRETLSEKDETIEQLQQEVIQLNEQTTEVRAKLDELQELEYEIRMLSGVGLSEPKEGEDDDVRAASAGGTFHPVDEDEILNLALSAGASLDELSHSLTVMSTRLDYLINELTHLQYLSSITPSLWPAERGRITSSFGYRLDPFTRRSAFHSGIDIDGSLRDDVYAAAAGTVSETGKNSTLGNYIVIDHSRGIKTLYAHLNNILVEPNDQVDKGDLIGLMGSTGRSTGTHLHFEVHEHGTPVDPTTYIKK